jgi:hypothetical protein
MMRTTVNIDDSLVKLAQERTHTDSAATAIKRALEDWARRMRIEKIKSFRGKLHFDMDWKEMRELDLKRQERLFGKSSR